VEPLKIESNVEFAEIIVPRKNSKQQTPKTVPIAPTITTTTTSTTTSTTKTSKQGVEMTQ